MPDLFPMAEPTGTMLVTGGSRGIGAATALQAAAKGWDVALTYRTQAQAAADVVAACQAAGARAVAYEVDLAGEDAAVQLFKDVDNDLGPLRCLVNNAGILYEVSRLEDISLERLRSVFEVNVFGAFVCAREAVRRMATDLGGTGGTIVNVSSAASYLGSPNEFVDYAASKGAMDTMTIGLAKEVADRGIRVNAVRPGLIETDIHADAGVPDRVARLQGNVPMQRGGTADEVADLILYLSGDQSTYITGSLINIAGGR